MTSSHAMKSPPESAAGSDPHDSMRRPRLAIVTTVARADFCEPLRWLDKFEVWHFYGTLAPDVRTDRLTGSYLRFRNTVDLLVGLLKVKPDLIQGSEPYDFPEGFKLSCVALLAAGLLRRPFYFPTFENIPPEVKYSRRRGIPVGIVLAPLLRLFTALYSRKCSAVFAGNAGAVRNLQALHTPASRIRRELYATWGVDMQLFSPDGPRSPAIRDERTLLFVGRLVEQKGIRQLLQAFLLVLKHQPDVTLVFIGSGPLAGEITESASAHNMQDHVRLLGPVPNCDLPPYFRAAKVTVAPSVTMPWSAEQVGMVAIQSIASGTPVVTTGSGSIPEFIENGISGLVVPERDPQALADAVLSLLENDGFRQALAASGRACAERRYNAARNVARVQSILLRLLSTNRRPAVSAKSAAARQPELALTAKDCGGGLDSAGSDRPAANPWL
jgi:glycosyltransferase involved in cell wall biosynthesis